MHWGTSLHLGGGILSLFGKKNSSNRFVNHHRDWIGVVTPEVNMELNMARWLKINAGLGYRFVFGVEDAKFTNSEGNQERLFEASKFSSPVLNIKFLFGVFGPKSS